jgi:hypothetical protein
MSVYFLAPNSDSAVGGDTITQGVDDDMSLASGRSIVDQVSRSHPFGATDAVISGQGTTAEVDYAGRNVIQPGHELEPRADITMGLPEPGIWVMLFIGFVGLYAAVFRRGRTDRLGSVFGEDHPSLDLPRIEDSSRKT